MDGKHIYRNQTSPTCWLESSASHEQHRDDLECWGSWSQAENSSGQPGTAEGSSSPGQSTDTIYYITLLYKSVSCTRLSTIGNRAFLVSGTACQTHLHTPPWLSSDNVWRPVFPPSPIPSATLYSVHPVMPHHFEYYNHIITCWNITQCQNLSQLTTNFQQYYQFWTLLQYYDAVCWLTRREASGPWKTDMHGAPINKG